MSWFDEPVSRLYAMVIGFWGLYWFVMFCIEASKPKRDE